MRVKAIRRTNKFAEIPFAEIIKDPIDRRILTPSGFQPVLACQKTKTGPTIVIDSDCGRLECDPNHRVLTAAGTEKFAKDLDCDLDRLTSYHNKSVSFRKSEGGVQDLYDIQLPDPHWWYTSGIVSHNSILLCNNSITSLRGMKEDGTTGQDVLLVTFELDAIKTAMRCLGVISGVPTDEVIAHQEFITRTMNSMKSYGKQLCIYELPPEECSVSHLYTLLDNLKRTKGWKPDVIILDYLELMVSRNKAANNDDYTRQKSVASEIRGLARNEKVLIFTAMQTNRSGSNTEAMIDLDKTAESYGKNMSLDYVITLNQTIEQRMGTPAEIMFWIAKNRNGPKHLTVRCDINYRNMQVIEAA